MRYTFANSFDPTVVEHYGADDEGYCSQSDHSICDALIAKLLIEPTRLFNCLCWLTKPQSPLNEGTDTDDQHANTTDHKVGLNEIEANAQTQENSGLRFSE